MEIGQSDKSPPMIKLKGTGDAVRAYSTLANPTPCNQSVQRDNGVVPLIVYTTVMLGGMIYVTAGLSYIGLRAQPPSPEWGAILNYGRVYLREAWWMSVFPGAAIFVAVWNVNLLGDGLRDALDPKLRN